MRSIFIRDVVIALLLSVITTMQFDEWYLMLCMPLPCFFGVIAAEEYTECIKRRIRIKRIVKKLRNGKVLPPTKARQDQSKTTP